MKTQTVTDKIIELAKREGGVSSSDIPGVTSADLSARCCSLVRRGRLFRAGEGRGNIRYFATAEAAEKYNKETPTIPMVSFKEFGSSLRFSPSAKEVFTKNTKFTKCPTPEPRFKALDIPNIYSANQRGRISGAA